MFHRNPRIDRLWRKYHRWLAFAFALPLLLTIVTGIALPIAKALHQRQLARFLVHLHTLETFGLDEVFPIITGFGLLGLIVTSFCFVKAKLPEELGLWY